MSLKYIVLAHIIVSLPNKTTKLKSIFFPSKRACECAFDLQVGKPLANCLENRWNQNEWVNEKNEAERGRGEKTHSCDCKYEEKNWNQ